MAVHRCSEGGRTAGSAEDAQRVGNLADTCAAAAKLFRHERIEKARVFERDEPFCDEAVVRVMLCRMPGNRRRDLLGFLVPVLRHRLLNKRQHLASSISAFGLNGVQLPRAPAAHPVQLVNRPDTETEVAMLSKRNGTQLQPVLPGGDGSGGALLALDGRASA